MRMPWIKHSTAFLVVDDKAIVVAAFVVAPRHDEHQAYWADFLNPTVEKIIWEAQDRQPGSLADSRWLRGDFLPSLPVGWGITGQLRPDRLSILGRAWNDWLGKGVPTKLASSLRRNPRPVEAGRALL